MERFSLHRPRQRMPFWAQVLVVIVAALLSLSVLELMPSRSSEVEPGSTSLLPTEDVTSSPVPTATQAPTETVGAVPVSVTHPTPTLLPPEEGIIYAVEPYVNRVGWVARGQTSNHFGTSELLTGFYRGRTYHGAFQFDLSFIALDSSIQYAALELTGLDTEQPTGQGTWSVQMLGPDVDAEWPLHGFDQIHQASVAYTLSPILDESDLASDKTYVFVFNADQRAELERRIAGGVVSFRMDGPSSGVDSLFAWDTGYGDESRQRGPILRLVVVPPAIQSASAVERPASSGSAASAYVIITSVPTPENVLTAAVRSLTATAWATMVGTPTPVPEIWVTPIIVTATPTPENAATATAEALVAEAMAFLTGTPTPTPGNMWTATPTPTYVVITPVPTHENELTAVAEALTATAWAMTTGTPTPLPANWVTPIIVTATPTPANRSTAEARAALATAEAFLFGTPTQTPENIWVVTATPTPLFVYVWDLPSAGVSTPTPSAIPFSIRGKIAFVSNRQGQPAHYIMDTNGGMVAWLTNSWAYEFVLPLQRPAPDGVGNVSPDGLYVVYEAGPVGNRQVWIKNIDGTGPRNISNNTFDEHDPVWLSSTWPTLTPTPTSMPTPTPTVPGPSAPSAPKPTKPPPPV